MRKPGILFMLCLLFATASAQKQKAGRNNKVYKINYKYEVPATLGLYAVNYYGLGKLKEKPIITEEKVLALDPDRLLWIDTEALSQSVSQRFNAQNISDISLNITLFSPLLLFLDKEIRKDWLDIAVLYLETQSINANLYTWGGPMYTNRFRPQAYYENIPLEERRERGSNNSFFSGHVSWTAGASFFMAKVISDYHPELGPKKWWLYAAALVPPAFVGYHRIRGLRHFPTDVMTGMAVGALVGILNPQLHKNRKYGAVMSVAPVAGEYTGLYFRMKF